MLDTPQNTKKTSYKVIGFIMIAIAMIGGDIQFYFAGKNAAYKEIVGAFNAKN